MTTRRRLRGRPPASPAAPSLPRPALLGVLLVLVAVVRPAAAQESADGAPEPVAIGLVVPADDALVGTGEAIRRAAEREVRRANDAGGYRGRPFALRVVTEDGLWGRGLSRVVSLSFDGSVWGVIGGFDGRGAHLIQQVVTKARVPFITPWASDFTLSRGMIPWFFQAIPDDRQQAAAVARDLRSSGQDGDVLVIADTTYDSRQFADAARWALDEAGIRSRVRTPEEIGSPEDRRPGTAPVTAPGTPRRAATRPAAVVLAVESARVPGLLRRLARLPEPPTAFAPLRLAVAPVLRAAGDYPAPLLFPAPGPLDPASVPSRASVSSAFAAGATRALIDAIRAAGLDRWRIRDELAAGVFDTPTGSLTFQESGRRGGAVVLVPAEHLPGAPVRRP